MAQYQQYQAGGGQQAPPAPKSPRKNPYYDGISSSAQHYDLFEVIRRPNLRRDNRPPDPPPRQMLSKQKKLEQEIEKKFRERRQKNEGSGSNVLAGLIRILFLALILPPYILLYRIPKFLFVDWVVKLTNAIDNYFVRIGKAIQQAYQRQKMKIRNAIVGFWQLIKTTFHKKMSAAPRDDDEPMSFLAFIAEGIVGLYRITLYPLIRASVKSWQFAKRSAKAVREFPMRLLHAIQDTLKRIRNLRDRLVSKVNTYLYETKEAIANRTIRPVSRWIDRQVEALIALYHRILIKLKKLIQVLLFAIRHPIQTSRMVLESIRSHSKRAYNSIEQAIRQWQESKKQAILAQWQRVRTWYEQNIVFPVVTRWNAIKVQILAWADRFKAPFVKIWVALRKQAAAVRTKITQLVNRFLEKLKAWMNKQKAALRSIYEPFKKACMARYAKIQDRISQRVEKVKKVFLALSEPFVWAGKELWSVLKPLVDPFIRFYQRAQSYADAFSYRLRLLAAWIVVLTRYGMELVRGTTEKLWNQR